MNSCLYECQVMHHRFEPKVHRFEYNVYMFLLDLDEIDSIAEKIAFISRNKFNLFSFFDKDHIHFPEDPSNGKKTVKDNILQFLCSKGIDNSEGKIFLLTNMRTFGYVFNPVSFFYCYDKHGKPNCVVVEVCNTFMERKLYLLENNTFVDEKFSMQIPKLFYVSPYSALDTAFYFKLGLPDDKLNINIDDFNGNRRILISTLTGTKKKLSNTNLIFFSLKFPLITLKVIVLIHWQAMLLYFKKIPFVKKASNPELQQEIYKF